MASADAGSSDDRLTESVGGLRGSFTAVMGIPALDGLSCPEARTNAMGEHISWRRLARRAGLTAGLTEPLDEVQV
jgi:hypothetical protein